MSLVNLAHACSHLQNASLARLGLTSIPYSKLHLSLALLLQKQGFLSQVKLGGPSPPASCFPTGARDNQAITAHPQSDAERNRTSPESALAQMIRHQLDSQQLREKGFSSEAIEFAETHGLKSSEELEAEGWRDRVVQFVTSLDAHVENQVAIQRASILKRSKGLPEANSGVRAAVDQARAEIVAGVTASLPPGQRRVWETLSPLSENSRRAYGITPDMLRDMAGPEAFKSERRINHEGITIDTMGVSISGQPVFLPDEQYADDSSLDAEGVVTQANRASRRLWLGLKYYNNSPVLSKARMISKPTKRIWLNTRDLAKIIRGSRAGEVKPLSQIGEIMAVSTDKGLMEARECVDRKIGGMPLCRVW